MLTDKQKAAEYDALIEKLIELNCIKAWNTRADQPAPATSEALDDLDKADNPDTNFSGKAYRDLRDMALIDWIEKYIETIRQALQQSAETVDLESLKEPKTAVRIEQYTKGFGDGWNACLDKLKHHKGKVIK